MGTNGPKHFITVLNGVITGCHHGDMGEELYGTVFYGHEKIEVDGDVQVSTLEPVEFYEKNWVRKPDTQLIDEKRLKMPKGYVREGKELRKLDKNERILIGLDPPPKGFKVDKKLNDTVEMTAKEMLDSGQITKEEFEKRVKAENEAELQRRLATFQIPEVMAQAEVDEEYAAERKEKIKSILAVKKQKGWPLEAKWPKE